MCADTNKGKAVIIFARHPTPGRVKTRLAAGVGDECAANFYRKCAEHIILECTRIRDADVFVFYSAEDEEIQVKHWLSSFSLQIELQVQRQVSDLGQRMMSAFEEIFRKKYEKAILVGTDVPDLTSSVIVKAFEFLDRYHVVFGPAVDGGYYLLGLRGPTVPRNIFSDIAWSTDSVLETSLRRAQQSGLDITPEAYLPRLRDIDTIEDLQTWMQDSPSRLFDSEILDQFRIAGDVAPNKGV